MKRIFKQRRLVGLLCVAVLALAGCGGSQEATPVPTAVTEAAGEAAEQAGSPLTEPDSPLVQPGSPLPVETATAQPAADQPSGPSIAIAVPSDIGIITQLAEETKAPAPQPGMAALSAILYSPTINRIIPGTQFYLTPAIEEDGQMYIPSMFVGPKEEEGDVVGITNDKGQILIDNVPPGNYYLAVWTVYDWPLAFGAATDALPLLITVEAGDVQDLGLLTVAWP